MLSAALFALKPFAHALHAMHVAHHLCEHGELVETERAEGGESRSTAVLPNGRPEATTVWQGGAVPAHAHAHCQVASSPRSPGVTTVVGLADGLFDKPFVSPERPPKVAKMQVDLLRQAPKTSPPSPVPARPVSMLFA